MQMIQICRVWRPCSGSSSIYHLVMIGITENISNNMAKMCQHAIMQSFSYDSQMKYFQIHADVTICSCFGMRKSCLSFSHLSVTSCISELTLSLSSSSFSSTAPWSSSNLSNATSSVPLFSSASSSEPCEISIHSSSLLSSSSSSSFPQPEVPCETINYLNYLGTNFFFSHSYALLCGE
jgi:hypothetical protein